MSDQLRTRVYTPDSIVCPSCRARYPGWTKADRLAGLPCPTCQFYGRKTLPPLCPECGLEPTKFGALCLACGIRRRLDALLRCPHCDAIVNLAEKPCPNENYDWHERKIRDATTPTR